MTVIPCQRHHFDIPDDIAYLNCGYMSPLARPVLAAVERGARLKAAPWAYTAHDFRHYPEAAREAFSRLLGCDADCVAIVPSASYGIAIATRNIAVGPGQNIVLLADQFPSNVYAWRKKASECGARIVHARRRDDDCWTDAVLSAIRPDTAIVAVPNCHWADGGLVDLERVADAARRVGAALVIDATQSLGALPLDLERVQPDYLVTACYKWMMGPYGTALLYVAPARHEGEPIEQGWFNRAGSGDFARLVDYRDDYEPGARRFDMGEMSNPPLMMGALAACELLLGWGVGNIADTLGSATAALANRARSLGLTVLDEEKRAPHFLALGFPGGIPDGLADRFAAERVFVSVRGRSLRVTPHVYNTQEDYNRLLALLENWLV
jgi:selenocysteine lyase/cysteine desulfurase